MFAFRSAVIAYLICAGSICLAQFTSNIQGSVQDPTQAAIPNATVKLRNLSTDVSMAAKSNESVVYRFSSLQRRK